MSVKDDKISAIDLSQVVVVESNNQKKQSGILSSQDLAFQEARRQRKIRKLEFDVRYLRKIRDSNPGTLLTLIVFKTIAINHSANLPIRIL